VRAGLLDARLGTPSAPLPPGEGHEGSVSLGCTQLSRNAARFDVRRDARQRQVALSRTRRANEPTGQIRGPRGQDDGHLGGAAQSRRTHRGRRTTDRGLHGRKTLPGQTRGAGPRSSIVLLLSPRVTDGGHGKLPIRRPLNLPTGGHRFSPWVAIESPHGSVLSCR
jgi:hypothetical protein